MIDARTAIRERRSIRAYTGTAVPAGLVREILDEARWAPSAGNTQSTLAFVVSGAALDRVKAALLEQAESEAPPSPDISLSPMPERLQQRMTDLFQTRAGFVAAEEARLGIVREGQPPAPPVMMAGLFGAPVLVLLAADLAVAHDYGCFDAGLFAQALATAAHARGLSTCLMASTLRAAGALHRALPQAEGTAFIIAITLGYADQDAPVNRFPRDRVAVDEYATFIE